MDITLKELSKIIGTSTDNLRIYLCRGEFAKCPTRCGVVKGIEQEQIDRLTQLLRLRKNRWER